LRKFERRSPLAIGMDWEAIRVLVIRRDDAPDF
jgi:hypothetical protein